MNNDQLTRLIQKYKSGSASAEEISVLEQFWKDAQQNSVLEKLSTEEAKILREAIFSKIQERIGVETRAGKPRKEVESEARDLQAGHEAVVPTHDFRIWRYGIAASIIFFIATVALLRWPRNKDIEIHTGFGEQLAVMLPDSSNVTLNGNTVLRYKSDWDESVDREVWIEGEGFFSVKHTKHDTRFVVHASERLNVEVLGTKFNVRSRALKSEVMLAEGKVKLDMENSKAESVYLKPGELAVMIDKKLSKHVVTDKRYTSWLTHTLMFERTPLRDVARLLYDTYGLEVQFADERLMNLELSGQISSASADDILMGISQIFKLKVDRKDARVVVFLERE
jgi:transmembrane sensor